MLGLPGRPTTDENGFYSTEVPWGWSGTIRPRMEGMYFDPNLRPYRNLTEDQLNQNFTALGGYVISGQVTDSQGFPAIGVRMLGLPEEPVTGNDGTYYDVVPPGWTGAVQPVKSGWMFEPEFRTYQGMSADMLEQDYLGGQIFFEWGSEIGLVNFSEEQRLSGDLIGFDFMGNETWRMPVDLAPEGRLELDLRVMPEAEAIQYIFFRGSGDSLGYQKFFKPEEYRVGLEAALDTTQAEELYIPHVDSSDDRDWWTGVAVVNTTDDPKTLTIHFKDADGEQAAESREIDLAPGEHNAFLIRSLFGNQHQPNIRSAQIENSEGLVGLELFGGLVTNRLSGVRLSEEKSTELVYPHIVEDEEWWTGINAYNPQYHDVDDVTAMMSVTYYNMGGTQVGLIEDAFVNSRTSKVNTGAGLPAGTAWQRVIADRPMLGFQLFGKYTGEQLAGYNVVNLASRVGVFPKIEKDGWTGIAFVNLEPETANIKLQALDNLGYVVAESDISMAPYSKKVELIEDVFDLDVDLATYVRYNSDRDVAGFQLNGTNDQTMLDAIPALSQAGSNLYYPHIHVGGERMRELIYRIIAE